MFMSSRSSMVVSTRRREEVEAFYAELESAAVRFNSASTFLVATILRRKRDGCDETTPYWKRIDGFLLSPKSEAEEVKEAKEATSTTALSA